MSPSTPAQTAHGIQAQIGGAQAHAVSCAGHRRSIGLLAGRVPAAPGLKLLEEAPVDLVARLHGNCLLRMLQGDSVVAQTAVGGCAVVIPLGAAFFHGAEDVKGFLEHTVVDIGCGGTKMDRLFAVHLARALRTKTVGAEKFVPEIGEILKTAIVGVGRPVFILPGLTVSAS